MLITLQLVATDGRLCVEEEEVHPESDHTSRSVDRNQVPTYKSDFKFEWLVGNTDLKPLNNNLHRVKHQLC